MTWHKTHIDRDGILFRFMKCLFIVDLAGWPRGTNKSDLTETVRSERFSLRALPLNFEIFF